MHKPPALPLLTKGRNTGLRTQPGRIWGMGCQSSRTRGRMPGHVPGPVTGHVPNPVTGHLLPALAVAVPLAVALCLAPQAARAQAIDLSHGGQITVTAKGGFDWDQNQKKVTAYDQAQAVRGDVTVTADKLIAYYRKKAPAPATPGTANTAPTDTGAGNAAGKSAGAAGAGTQPPAPPDTPPAKPDT
ncbi:MAG: hypothetical protein ABF791_11535, partial [Acetobacter sp.]